MKLSDHPHGVTFTTDEGLDIHVMLIGDHDGSTFLAVSTPHRRVDMRVSPKGHAIQHWGVSSPMTPGLMEHRAATKEPA